MTILLQDRNTGLYVGDSDQWAANPRTAKHFVCSSHALRQRQRLGARDVNLVFRFEDHGYAIAIPAERTADPPP